MVAEVVHKEEEIVIRLNEFASELDAAMTFIRISLEEASGTSDKITIHTLIDSCENAEQWKQELNTTMRAIKDAPSILRH